MTFFRSSYFVYDVTELTAWKVDITVQEPYTILLDIIMSNCKMLPNIFLSSLQSETSENIFEKRKWPFTFGGDVDIDLTINWL